MLQLVAMDGVATGILVGLLRLEMVMTSHFS